MADNTLSTRRDRLADIFRVFDKMWNLLDRVRENEEIQMHTDVDIANEIDAVLDEARRVRY